MSLMLDFLYTCTCVFLQSSIKMKLLSSQVVKSLLGEELDVSKKCRCIYFAYCKILIQLSCLTKTHFSSCREISGLSYSMVISKIGRYLISLSVFKFPFITFVSKQTDVQWKNVFFLLGSMKK